MYPSSPNGLGAVARTASLWYDGASPESGRVNRLPMSDKSATGNRQKTIGAETVVGLFVAMVFIALAIFTIVVSGSTLFNKKLYPMGVVLPDAMGLRRNDPVIARGTTVGYVEKVFYDTNGVHVLAMLDAPVVFHEGYDVTVVSTSILGGRQLVIKEGNPDAPVVKDATALVGRAPSDLFEDATEIVSHVSQGEGPLGKIIFDEAMASNLVEIVENIRAISADIADLTAKISAKEGTIGRLVYDDTLASDLAVGIAELRAAAGDISNMTAHVVSGEGTIGQLLYDETLATNLADTIASVKTIASRLENGDGTIGKLLDPADTEAWDDLKVAIANLKTISDRLANGEGTIGKLLSSDTELYDNLNGLLKDGRETIDDMREASPVSTLSSIALGAF